MLRWISAFVLTVSIQSLVSAGPLAAVQGPVITGPKVGTLKSYVPARNEFVVHGTMPVPPQAFHRDACPYVVVDPAGKPLVTQWEYVALLKDHFVVELSAHVVNTGGWTGRQTFDVYEGTNPFDVSGFDASSLSALAAPNTLRLWLLDHANKPHVASLTSGWNASSIHRFGPNRITLERDFVSPLGGLQTWLTLERGSNQAELVINWHNGALPARPDLYFRSLALELPNGYRWTPLLPDPAIAYPLLVRKGRHVLPQRWERSFRVIIHPTGTTPDLSLRGWAVGDWSDGGYMAQSLALPNLSHASINLTPKKVQDFDLLRNVLPTLPGSVPVNYLWPAQGVFYGGMTGGVDIQQFPEVLLAFSGQPDGLLSTLVEQLRYSARQMGCIYEQDGQPIDQDQYLNSDGTQPWDLFNNEFIGYPPRDAPFFWTQTGPGVGWASYDPKDYLPIDYQHYVRRTKANKALVWLDNDPLAKRYLMMDAELGRMCYYEGPDGRLVFPRVNGDGTEMGRGQAWVADAMVHAFAVAPGWWRNSRRPWFQKFFNVLRLAQMPNQLFSAQNFGKTATSPPYGDGHVAFYWVHNTNEQIFLMHALRAIQETVGLDAAALIANCGRGIWDFAWKVGTNGPLETYPAGPVGGARYASRSEIPVGLTDTVVKDNYHVANALALAQMAGGNLLPALLSYSETGDLAAAKAQFQAWSIGNIDNRAAALSLLQKLIP